MPLLNVQGPIVRVDNPYTPITLHCDFWSWALIGRVWARVAALGIKVAYGLVRTVEIKRL
jgi:hypothetical protein